MNRALEAHGQTDKDRAGARQIVAKDAGNIASRQRTMGDPLAKHGLCRKFIRHVQRIEIP